jgi:hypothetical protein
MFFAASFCFALVVAAFHSASTISGANTVFQLLP